MSIGTTASSKTYLGDGLTTAFATVFKFLAAAHLTVKRTVAGITSTLVLGVDYTVTGAGDSAGGTITLSAFLAVGSTLYIERNTPNLQPTTLRPQGSYSSTDIEGLYDYRCMVEQEIARRVTALEALPLVVTETANAVAVIVNLAVGDPVEANFPYPVAVANGQNARQVLMRVSDDGDDPDFVKGAPALNWEPGPDDNEITLLFVSDLKAGNDYQLNLLVLF